MTRWGEPEQESWLPAIVQWLIFLLLAAAIFVAVTAVDPPMPR